jgi:ABC-2 type transport system ATP-binding protein
LFLDEPTIGLDPSGRKLVWEHIQRLNKESGITIFLTTHYMDEADLLCDRIGIINRGKISCVDTPKALKDLVGAGNMTVKLVLGEAVKDPKEFLTTLLHDEVLSMTLLNDDKWQFMVPKVTHNGPRVLSKLMAHNIEINDLEIKSPTLEDAFIKLTGTKLNEEASKASWKSVKGRRRTYKRLG